MQWIILTNYAAKYQVSVSTLRRRIKNGQLEHRFIGGKYLLLDEKLQDFESTNGESSIAGSMDGGVVFSSDASHTKASSSGRSPGVISDLLVDKFRAKMSAVQNLATASESVSESEHALIQARELKLSIALKEFDREGHDIDISPNGSSDTTDLQVSGVESSFAPSKRRSEIPSEQNTLLSEEVVTVSDSNISPNAGDSELFATDEEINAFRLPGFAQSSAYQSSLQFEGVEVSANKVSDDVVEDFKMQNIISELRPLTEQAESQIKSMKTPEPMIASATKVLADLKRAYASVLHEKEEQIIQLKEEVSDLKTLVRALESENTRRYPTQSAL